MPQWSPDGKSIAYQGTKRGLASSESFMEDTHIWLVNADGSDRRELGASIDNRQGPPVWAPDGSAVYSTVQERGNVRLYRLPVSGAEPQVVVGEPGQVVSFSLGKGDALAYSFHSVEDLPQLYVNNSGATEKQVTDLNADVLGDMQIAEVEALTFLSHDHQEVEAFLTQPLEGPTDSKHPMIVLLKEAPIATWGRVSTSKLKSMRPKAGNPHDQHAWLHRLRPGFATLFSECWVVIVVSRKMCCSAWGGPSTQSSSGPGSARDRGWELWRQMSAWIISQTHGFQGAIPAWGIYNLLTFNYLAYYHDYMAVSTGLSAPGQ